MDEKEKKLSEEVTSYDKKKNTVKFTYSNHTERADIFGRISDGETSKFLNVALEYFNYRCALTGERFVKFDKSISNEDEETQDIVKLKSNLSAEHMVPLFRGGDDIVPNLFPTVYQFNIQKNGYYPIDYMKQAKNANGQSIYSPYRLLKIINYMMKSSTVEARECVRDKDVKKFKKIILTPNAIDKYIKGIEEKDSEKLFSAVETGLDESKKKLKALPSFRKENYTRYTEGKYKITEYRLHMMDIFLHDSIKIIESEKEIVNAEIERDDGTKTTVLEQLKQIYEKSVKGNISFEIKVRDEILSQLKELGIEENQYTVANELLQNTEILDLINKEQDEEEIKKIINKEIKTRYDKLKERLGEEQLTKIIPYIPNVLYKEGMRNRVELWNKYRKGKIEDLKEKGITQTDDFIDTLIILKENGVDIRNIQSRDTIESVLKKQGIEGERKKEIIEKIKEITNNLSIGNTLNTQKGKNNIEKLKKELNETINKETGEKIFTDEEIQFLTENQKSNDQTRDFIDTLITLKKYGVDIRNIQFRDTIESVLKNQGIEGERQKEIIEKIKDITNNLSIGNILTTQKGKNNIEKLKKGLNEEINKETGERIFTDEEIQFLTENQKSNDQTRDFIDTLMILKKYGVDIRNIQSRDTIESVLKKQGIEGERKKEIIEKIKEITNNLSIGNTLYTQKEKNNIVTLEKGLNETINKETGERIFTDEEIQFLTEKSQISNDQTIDFIDTLIILKKYGVDIRNIQQKDTIESILEKQEIEEENQKEIIEKIKEITNNLSIGITLSNQKRKNNIDKLKKRLNETINEETGERIFTDEEIQFLTENQKSNDQTRDFIDTLVILKENGVDIRKIQKKDTIESILEKQEIEEENQKEIIEKIKEITNNLSIGITLKNQKGKKNIEKLKKELNETINKETGERIFTDEEIQFLTEKSQISNDQTRDFIDALIILKKYGVDIRNIQQKDTIEDILKSQGIEGERKKEIIEKIKEITNNLSIGNTLNTQKGKNNIEKLKKGLNETINEETGEKIFTDEEIQFLTENQKSNDQTRDFIDTLVILKENGVDIRKIQKKDTIESILEKQEIEEENQKEIIEKIKDITNNLNIGNTLTTQKGKNNIEKLKKGLNETINEETGEKIFTDEEIQFLTEKQKSGRKMSKQVVAEQKEKGDLGENDKIKNGIFVEIILQAENRKDYENIK